MTFFGFFEIYFLSIRFKFDNDLIFSFCRFLVFFRSSFSFKDLWYTIKLPKGEELDLLKGVSGYFEPGTLTALVKLF